MAGKGRGLFSPYIYIENFNDLLVRNHWTDFNLMLQKCFLCNPLSRLCKPSWFIKKQGRQGAGLIFPIYLYRKTKSLLSETTGPISLQLGKNVSLVTLYLDCSSNHDLSKNKAASGWDLFSLIYLYRKLKNLLVRNQWTDFNITWQECFFGDPLPRLFKLSWSSKNMAATGQGLFFPIYLYKKL